MFLLIFVLFSSVSAQAGKAAGSSECLLLFELSGIKAPLADKTSNKAKSTQVSIKALENKILSNRVANSTPVKRLSKEELLDKFLDFYYERDKDSIRQLVLDYPSLKKARLPLPKNVLEEKSHQSWFNLELGWTPLQMISYDRDLEFLDLLLKLGFDYKSKKRTGGVSIEYNPLHISIVRDFPEGARAILEFSGLEKFGRSRKPRFIDEKTNEKITPWALAVFQDIRNGNTEFVDMIGGYEPSGYVESYVDNTPLDGHDIAKRYGVSEMESKADEYLKSPKLEKYRTVKRNSRNYRKRTRRPYY